MPQERRFAERQATGIHAACTGEQRRDLTSIGILVAVTNAFVGCLLFFIPWSERYCFLDNFPHGQDFETNLLAFLALSALMLLVAHLCQQSVAAFLTLGCWILRMRVVRSQLFAHALTGPNSSTVHRIPLPSPLSAASLPLRI